MINYCPLCDSMPGKISFPYFNDWNGSRFKYRQCVKCKTSFILPIPKKIDFEKMYSKSAYHDIHYNNIDFSLAQKSIYRFAPHLVAGSSLLDFGCGNGNFLLAARLAGFACSGVEYEISARQLAMENSGCPVYTLDELFRRKDKFDVIHLGDVLEHLADPFLMMNELSLLLKPGGYFIIEGPLEANPSIVYFSIIFFAWIKKLLGVYSGLKIPPTHLFMTNANAQLIFFTNRLNYRCIKYETYETGWPYLSKKSLKGFNFIIILKSTLGCLAIIFSFILPVFSNRFAGIFKP